MIDWSKAPEWANYAAMDGKDGKWWWTADRPEHLNNCWDKGVCASMDKPYPAYDGDWKDSLQERPKTSEGLTVGMLKELLKDINDDCLVLITNKEFDGNGMIAAYEPGCMTPATDQGAVILRGTWK